MTHTTKRNFAARWLALAVVVATGCSASSEYMHPAAAGVTAPSAAEARVVFIRPSGYAGGMKTTILDGHGQFLGDSLPESYFTVGLPAGEHVFIAWAENTAALRAKLSAGKTYYVEVAPKMGVLSARMHLLALKPGSENWGGLRGWLNDSAAMQADRRAGQAYLASRSEDVQERLKRAREVLGEYTPEELGERTLAPQDGQ